MRAEFIGFTALLVLTGLGEATDTSLKPGDTVIECACPSLGGAGFIHGNSGQWLIRELQSSSISSGAPDTEVVLSIERPTPIRVYFRSPPVEPDRGASCAEFLLRVDGDNGTRWWSLLLGYSDGEPMKFRNPHGRAEPLPSNTEADWLLLSVDHYGGGVNSTYEWTEHVVAELDSAGPRLIGQVSCSCGEQGGVCGVYHASYWDRRTMKCIWTEDQPPISCQLVVTLPRPWGDHVSLATIRLGAPDSTYRFLWSDRFGALRRWELLSRSHLEGWIAVARPHEGMAEAIAGLGQVQVIRSFPCRGDHCRVLLLAAPSSRGELLPDFFKVVIDGQGRLEITAVVPSALDQAGQCSRQRVPDRSGDNSSIGLTPVRPAPAFLPGPPLPSPQGLHLEPLLITQGSARIAVLVGADMRSDDYPTDILRLADSLKGNGAWACYCGDEFGPSYAARVARVETEPLELVLDFEPKVCWYFDDWAETHVAQAPDTGIRARWVKIGWDAKSGFTTLNSTPQDSVRSTLRLPVITDTGAIELVEYPYCELDDQGCLIRARNKLSPAK
jgi:hypothetical protein